MIILQSFKKTTKTFMFGLSSIMVYFFKHKAQLFFRNKCLCSLFVTLWAIFRIMAVATMEIKWRQIKIVVFALICIIGLNSLKWVISTCTFWVYSLAEFLLDYKSPAVAQNDTGSNVLFCQNGAAWLHGAIISSYEVFDFIWSKEIKRLCISEKWN